MANSKANGKKLQDELGESNNARHQGSAQKQKRCQRTLYATYRGF